MSLYRRLNEAGGDTGQDPRLSQRADPAIGEIRHRIHGALIEELGPILYDTRMDEDELRKRVHDSLHQALAQERTPLSAADKATLIQDVSDDILGYGPIDKLLREESVSEIMCNGPKQIYVERGGKLELDAVTFVDETHLRRIIDKIVAQVGRRIDESSPLCDARLPDGSRVNAVISPLSVGGPFLTIADERIITVEDAKELQLAQDHVLSLETRPPNVEGKGEVSIRELVKNTLRMRPDRIVVGECRSGEALDMLQAMNTGHDGSLTTLHANNPRDSLSRLETLVLMAGYDLPVRAIREQISSAVDMIVQLQRLRDGSRRITHITEVAGMEGEIITLQDVFLFDYSAGVDEHGRFKGQLKPTGVRPKFSQKLADHGIRLGPEMFSANQGEAGAQERGRR